MIKVTMQYARNNFGSVIRASQSQPVIVCKANRAHAVFISDDEYSELIFLKSLHFLLTGREYGDNDESLDCQRVDYELLAQVQRISEMSGVSVGDMVRRALSAVVEEHSLKGEHGLSKQDTFCWSLEDLIRCKDVS
jgi:hypothetical protein